MQRDDGRLDGEVKQLTQKQLASAYSYFLERIDCYLSSPENLLEAFKSHAYSDKDNSGSELNLMGGAENLKQALKELDEDPDSQSTIFLGNRHANVAKKLFSKDEEIKYGIVPSIAYVLSAISLAAGADLMAKFSNDNPGQTIPLMPADIGADPTFIINQEINIRESLMKAKIIDYARAVRNAVFYTPTQNRNESLVSKAVHDYLLAQCVDSLQTEYARDLAATVDQLSKIVDDSVPKLPIELLTQHAALSLLGFVVEHKGNSDGAHQEKLTEVMQLAQQLLLCRGNPGLGQIRKQAYKLGKEIEKEKADIALLGLLARLIYQIDKRMMFGGKGVDFNATVTALQKYINEKIAKSGSKNANASELIDMIQLIGDARISPATKLTDMCAAMQEVLSRKSTQGFFVESKLEACLIGILNQVREGKHLIYQDKEKLTEKPSVKSKK